MSPRDFGKVAVLLGGRSAEREISLMSGKNVLEGLRRAGVDAHPFDPAEQSLFALKEQGFERAFIALHGRYGEDGTVQGALELMDIPYTGSGVMASALCMDKLRTKYVWVACGLPTPRWMVLEPTTDWHGVAARLGLPLIVKPAREGSTLGLTKVTRVEDLPEAYATAARYDSLVLAEEFVEGQELTAGFVGDQALPLVRIEAPGGNYDYQNKYFSDETRYYCPCGLPPEEEQAIQALTMRAVQVLGCRGWGRADMIRRADGTVTLLEMNTAPGMTSHSLVPMAAKAAGMSFETLVLKILELARVG
ncbi:MAG: D-alanine--D-alanine ligase [Azospira oryzae]|nr:MAG: D-alanine--D-alanine ligase [Azospira oryzae]PZP81149.1 MAG: D-alanine--D-alanine ligase [Azospira oryzae]